MNWIGSIGEETRIWSNWGIGNLRIHEGNRTIHRTELNIGGRSNDEV